MKKHHKTHLQPVATHQAPNYPTCSTRRMFMRQLAIGAAAISLGGIASGAPQKEVTEDRLLNLKHGYVLRFKWTCPESNTALIQQLEASEPILSSYLQQNANPEKLHDRELHTYLERELVSILTPKITPAIIIEAALEHDCSQVCQIKPIADPKETTQIPPTKPLPPQIPTSYTETRTLSLNRGYVITLNWTRPVDDSTLTALNGTAPQLDAYLSQNSNSQKLHDTPGLANLERGLMTIINVNVTPAVVTSLSLQHSCHQICRPRLRGRRR